jgi:DNA-binding transcriptional ArsR family regulator
VASYSELRLGDPDGAPPRVLAQRGAGVMSIVAEALGGRSQGVPAHWRAAVVEAAPPGAAELLRPLFAPGSALVPDSLTLTSPLAADNDREQLERLRDLPPDVLLGELDRDFEGRLPEAWLPVVERPRQFLREYAAVMESAYRATSTLWAAARPLLDREVERVALLRGNVEAILAGAGRLRVDRTVVRVPDPHPTVFERAGRELMLIPLVSGHGASVFSFDRPDVVWIGYPLPGLGALVSGSVDGPAAADPLAIVLGATRAAILRALSGGPAGTLAAAVGCSPATLTHHCDQLAAAGLLVRERSGQRVLLHRTRRGDDLLALLAR